MYINRVTSNHKSMKYIEKASRSLIKSISWRIISTVDTLLISWLITGDIKISISIGIVEFFTKTIIYYIHERAWIKIDFGKKIIKQ